MSVNDLERGDHPILPVLAQRMSSQNSIDCIVRALRADRDSSDRVFLHLPRCNSCYIDWLAFLTVIVFPDGHLTTAPTRRVSSSDFVMAQVVEQFLPTALSEEFVIILLLSTPWFPLYLLLALENVVNKGLQVRLAINPRFTIHVRGQRSSRCL